MREFTHEKNENNRCLLSLITSDDKNSEDCFPFWSLYRVYKKKLNKFEIAVNVTKRLKV